MMDGMPESQVVDRQRRAALLSVSSYEIGLELDEQRPTFRSTTSVAFRCRQIGADTLADLVAESVQRVVLNGRDLPVADVWDGHRLALHGLDTENLLEVEATFRYTTAGHGMRRVVDPADGSVYIYGAHYPHSAPSSFC